MAKYEWRKQEKALYLPETVPMRVTVPNMKFFTISGAGNPNGEEFAAKVRALYSLAYAVRMMPKKGITPDGYYEYTVYPLEGVWDLTEQGRAADILCKDDLVYTVMIRQPDFVTTAVWHQAVGLVQAKNPNALVSEIVFEESEERSCLQMLHVGSYSTEPATFALMNDFAHEQGLERASMTHREIYLSDPSRTEEDKLRTVLRYRLK